MEAGENLGFLPGTLFEKVDPYIRPLYDALYSMFDQERANACLLYTSEFSDSKALLPVIEVLEDDRVLLNTFDEAAAEGGPVMVRIGQMCIRDRCPRRRFMWARWATSSRASRT